MKGQLGVKDLNLWQDHNTGNRTWTKKDRLRTSGTNPEPKESPFEVQNDGALRFVPVSVSITFVNQGSKGRGVGYKFNNFVFCLF